MRKRTVLYIALFVIMVVGLSSQYLAPYFNRTCNASAKFYDEWDYVGTQQGRGTPVYVLSNGNIQALKLLCIEVSNGSSQKAANAAVGDTYAMSFFFSTVPLHVKIYLL